MTENFRVEEDLLGIRAVPNDAYYGVHTLRAMENFKISTSQIGDIPEFVRGMVMVKKAVAMTNLQMGVISEDIARTIIDACDEVLNKGKCMDQFKVDVFQGGAGTSVNMNTNEVLCNIGLELMGHRKGEYQYLNPNDHLNECQSTNDAYPTGLRIALYMSVTKLTEALDYLSEGLKAKGNEFKKILKMGRTQLQDAVPMTLGQEFYGFESLLREACEDLKKSAYQLLTVNLGATAIGTGLNTPKGYQNLAVKILSDVTKLPCTPAANLIGATSDCSAYVNVHGALKSVAVRLSKICNDLRLLSSGPRAGLNEINLPELQAGSSIMPAKVNPVIPEVVNQVCFKVFGNDTCVTMASDAGQLQLNVMEPVIAQAMFESVSLLSNGCRALRDKCINGITANKEICENYVYNSIGIVTYLNPFIGHHNGDVIGKICAETGKSVRQAVLEKGLLSESDLDEIFSIENLMNPSYKSKHHKK